MKITKKQIEEKKKKRKKLIEEKRIIRKVNGREKP